jgi:PAS domain S-box-containing protein
VIPHFSVYDHLSIGVAITDTSFNIQLWNACIEDWTGWKREEVVNKSLFSLFPHLEERHYKARFDLLLETRAPVIFSWQVHGSFFPHRSDRERKRIQHVTATWITDPSGTPCILFSVEDRTEVSLRIKAARNKEKELQQAVKEKEFLMKELNHRVKNNLTMILGFISIQRDSFDDSRMIQALDDLDGRVRTFSALHEYLYKNDTADAISAPWYLEKVTGDLFVSMRKPGAKTELFLDVEPLFLKNKSALYIGLITVEALTNAVKYGMRSRTEGKVTVTLQTAQTKTGQGRIVLTIRDDGTGFTSQEIALAPAHPREMSKTESMGLKLIDILAREMGAKVERFNEKGAVICITFNPGIIAEQED